MFFDIEPGIRGAGHWDEAQKIRHTLTRAIRRNPADALLLSGGVDSSILAALDPKTPAVTVGLIGRGDDLHEAEKVTSRLSMPWHRVELTYEQAQRELSNLIYLTKNYDPAIKNDLAIYYGLMHSASLGFRTVRTGDGGDELFIGYSALYKNLDTFNQNLINFIPHMRFPATRLSRAMGMRVNYPYLDKEVLNLAVSLDVSDNVALLPGFGPGDYAQQFDPDLEQIELWGKISLRNSSYGLLLPDTIWREKKSIEYGSGTIDLEQIILQQVTRQEIREMRRSGKRFWNKYHGKLYLMYRDMGLEPETPKQGEYPCGWCGGGVIENRSHCSTCGGYPSNAKPRRVFQSE